MNWDMGDVSRDEGLAMLLQATCDFAFQQMAQGHRLVPFAGQVLENGDLEFVRFVDEDTEIPMAEVYTRTQLTMADLAGDGKLVAASTVAAVAVEKPEELGGFREALRVHVEAPGYSRVVLAPYRLIEGQGDEPGEIQRGQLAAMEAAPAIFAG